MSAGAIPASARAPRIAREIALVLGTNRYGSEGTPQAANLWRKNCALLDCGLPQLAQRLDEEQNWAQVLSGGEQQRVAFARALLYKPQWLFMDEATASLDDASETRLYTLLHERLPDTCIVSTGHHPNLAQFHARRLRLEDDPAGLGHLIPEELSERARPSIPSRKR